MKKTKEIKEVDKILQERLESNYKGMSKRQIKKEIELFFHWRKHYHAKSMISDLPFDLSWYFKGKPINWGNPELKAKLKVAEFNFGNQTWEVHRKE